MAIPERHPRLQLPVVKQLRQMHGYFPQRTGSLDAPETDAHRSFRAKTAIPSFAVVTGTVSIITYSKVRLHR